MLILIRFIGIVMLSIGGAVIFYPKFLRNSIIPFWKEGNRVYGAAIIRSVIGIFFLWASPQCSSRNMIFIIGLILLLSGVIFFARKKEKWLAMLDWWQIQPDMRIRLLALLPFLLGSIIIYSV